MVTVEIIKNYLDAEIGRIVKRGEILQVTEERAKVLTDPKNVIKTVVARVISIDMEESKDVETVEELSSEFNIENETKKNETKKSKKKKV